MYQKEQNMPKDNALANTLDSNYHPPPTIYMTNRFILTFNANHKFLSHYILWYDNWMHTSQQIDETLLLI